MTGFQRCYFMKTDTCTYLVNWVERDLDHFDPAILSYFIAQKCHKWHAYPQAGLAAPDWWIKLDQLDTNQLDNVASVSEIKLWQILPFLKVKLDHRFQR